MILPVRGATIATSDILHIAIDNFEILSFFISLIAEIGNENVNKHDDGNFKGDKDDIITIIVIIVS